MDNYDQQPNLPKPLTAPGTDLRDFKYMPLDVVRFRDSDFAALSDAEAFRAGVMLWCAAWHQVPAASLPDDDRILANLAGFGRVVAAWLEVKDAALYGWVRCSDGRIYHPVVAEKANEAYEAKLKHRFKQFSDRIRKKNIGIPEEQKISSPEFKTWLEYECPSDWPPTKSKDDQNPKKTQKTPSDDNSIGNEDDSNKNSSDLGFKGKGEGEGELRDNNTTTSEVNEVNIEKVPLGFVRYKASNRKLFRFDDLLSSNPDLKNDFFNHAYNILEMPDMTEDVLQAAWDKISLWGAQAEKKTEHKWMVTWLSRFVRDEYSKPKNQNLADDFTFGDLAAKKMNSGDKDHV